jgi:vacuolar-type H+-ATPase subunit H
LVRLFVKIYQNSDLFVEIKMTGNRTEVLMSRESIKMIKQTEEEAERILREAQQKAAQMVADAEANGAALCESTEQETIAAAKVVIGQLREKAENMRERLNAEAKGEAAEIVRQASLRKRSAEKIVIRGLASKCR